MELADIERLYPQEKALIDMLRSFYFLELHCYHAKEITYGSRDYPSLTYLNFKNKMKIHIIGHESFYSVQIQRQKFFSTHRNSRVFDISDYFQAFNSGMIKGRNYTLKSLAGFIEQHLLSVIKGEKWIDELV